MRNLNKNKTTLWLVEKIDDDDEVDGNGNYTGEKINTYSAPVEISLSMYPATGEVIEKLFGKDASVDMVAISCSVTLTKDSLLFLLEPTDNFDTSFDYKVDSILESLNNGRYGLRRRV